MYKKLGISTVESYEGVGKSVISVSKRPKGADRCIFYSTEELIMKTSWFSDLFIFKRQCIYSSKRDVSL